MYLQKRAAHLSLVLLFLCLDARKKTRKDEKVKGVNTVGLENVTEFVVRYGIYIIIGMLLIWLIGAILKKSFKLIVMIVLCLAVSLASILLVNKLVGDVSISVKDGIVYYEIDNNKGELDISKILDIDTEYIENEEAYDINIKYGSEEKEFNFKVGKTQYKLFIEKIVDKISAAAKSIQQ